MRRGSISAARVVLSVARQVSQYLREVKADDRTSRLASFGLFRRVLYLFYPRHFW